MEMQLILFILFLTLTAVSCTVYYADSSRGLPGNPGSSTALPFSTIKECVDALVVPGDECRIRQGRYHEHVEIFGKHGNKDAPFVIAGYMDERPIIDGTVEIKATWIRFDKRAGVYKVTSFMFVVVILCNYSTNTR